MTIVLESDGQIDDHADDEFTAHVATSLMRKRRPGKELDSRACAGIAKLRARQLRDAGEILKSIGFELHAATHALRADILGQTERFLSEKTEAA